MAALLRAVVVFGVLSGTAASSGPVPALDPAAAAAPKFAGRKAASADLPLAALAAAARRAGGGSNAPEQLHVALAGPSGATVSWVTPGDAKYPRVRWGPGLSRAAAANTTRYSCLGVPCGGHYRSGAIHHAVIGPFVPGETVAYEVDDEAAPEAGSEAGAFVVPPGPELAEGTQVALVGDLGQTADSNATVEHLARAVDGGASVIVHVGDLSYADCYQPRWDSYGRLVERLAKRVPWMTVVGNHEVEPTWLCGLLLNRSFAAYRHRYGAAMPWAQSASPSPLYYSFESAGAHWVMLASYDDFDEGSDQMAWLKRDLASVDRARTPWLFAVVHAPWYNSNTVHQHEKEEDQMRASMEGLLRDAGLDAMFAGHVHAYERVRNVFDGVPAACAPAYVNIGDGGNREGLARAYLDPAPAWSAYREASFGHGVLTLANATHARWVWHRDQDGERVESDVHWLVKDPACRRPE